MYAEHVKYLEGTQAHHTGFAKADLENIGGKKMKKEMLPVLAAFIIALLVIPAIPVNALVPATTGLASVVTVPEDDLKRNTGLMVLGLTPGYLELFARGEDPFAADGGPGWFTDSACTLDIPPGEGDYGGYLVGPQLSSEPVVAIMPEPLDDYYNPDLGAVVLYQRSAGGQGISVTCTPYYFMPLWPDEKGVMGGMDLLSQHKILATLNGVPTTPTYVLCEIVEKEKAKIPPTSTKATGKRQFDDEMIKTTLKDVTNNFICKFHWIKPGVGALDVYFVGPRVKDFIADHMLIITVGYKINRTTIWASDLQDICILGWSMGREWLSIALFKNPGQSTGQKRWEFYDSWDDPLYNFVSCDEAAAWQLAWIYGGWPYSTN